MQKNSIYKCNVCGNIVEITHVGGGTLVCCGQPMDLLVEKISDQGMEKHVPVIEKIDGGYKVKIGSVPHPMESAHYIEWIEFLVGEKVYREYLAPGMAPEAVFMVDAENVSAREYCNVHGLWRTN